MRLWLRQRGGPAIGWCAGWDARNAVFGAFAINALDAARLRAGMVRLRAIDPTQAAKIEGRARAWIEAHGS